MADAESFLDKAKAKGKEIVGEVEDKADDLKDKASETLGKLTDDK